MKSNRHRYHYSVRWCKKISNKLVLYAILFTIYIAKLLVKLKRPGLGCRMGNSYVGALSYADDITLICPSIRGLDKMIDISFADI